MRKISIILSVFALIASSCGNKKKSFDYSTLPTEWTELSFEKDDDDRFFVCEEATELIIEGNKLTFLYISVGEKWELEISNSYQIGDTVVFNVKSSDENRELKLVWRKEGTAEWIYDGEGLIFVPNEKLSEFPKVKCSYDDGYIKIINVETKSKNPEDLVRSDETIFSDDRISGKIFGDLNNDGEKDCVIITKQTKQSAFVTDESRGELDRNRRGIVIAFKNGEYYETAFAIPDCFLSENEDGGVYFPPELDVEIKNGNLIIRYLHGRYGQWEYIFRYQNGNFELIGYNESNDRGPVVESIVSINFLTKKKQTLLNTNPDPDSEGETVFEETWQDIGISNLVKLTDIDFGEFSVSDSYVEKRKEGK